MYNNNNPLYQQNSSGQQPLLNPQYQDQNQQINQQFAQQNYQQHNQLQNQNQNAQYNPPAPQNQIMCLPNSQNIQDPGLLYCQQSIRKRNICDNNSTAVTNLMILLEQILAQLPLRFTFLQVAGNSNIYSSQFYEEKIIRPLITENTHVNEQVIRNSYVAFCSQKLSKHMKYCSIFIIAFLLVTIGYLAGMNLIYFNNNYSYINSLGSVNIIYICQIVFIIINLILFIFATLKNNPRLVLYSYFTSAFNQLFIVAEICCSFIISYDYMDAYLANLYISFAPIILLFISTFLIKEIQIIQMKLLVLLGQADKNEFYKI